MLVEHYPVVHLVDVVARKYEHVLRVVHVYEVDVVIDRVRCALVPLSAGLSGIRRQDVHSAVSYRKIPGLAGPYVSVQDERLVLHQDADGIYTRIHAVREAEVDDAVLASERYCRLCDVCRQATQSAALPAGKQHRDAFFLFHE